MRILRLWVGVGFLTILVFFRGGEVWGGGGVGLVGGEDCVFAGGAYRGVLHPFSS